MLPRSELLKLSKIVFSKYVLGLFSAAESGWTNSKFKNRRPLLRIRPFVGGFGSCGGSSSDLKEEGV